MAETTQSGGRGVSLVFDSPLKTDREPETYICVRRDGLYIGSMRRPYRWSAWVWYPRHGDGNDSVKLHRDTHAAKVKLRELLS